MATFDVKTISCSSKITVKIEVNMDSLEREYKGNILKFGKTFAIDSGKGSNYTGLWLSFFLYIDSLQKTKKKLPFFAKKQKKIRTYISTNNATNSLFMNIIEYHPSLTDTFFQHFNIPS